MTNDGILPFIFLLYSYNLRSSAAIPSIFSDFRIPNSHFKGPSSVKKKEINKL